MATPEIKAKQVNTADLKSQKTTSASMPKTETTSSEKLASTLSGNKTTTFGKFSKDSSLASSLSHKAGSSSDTKNSVFGSATSTSSTKTESVFGGSETTSAPQTQQAEAPQTSDVSIYEQTSLKSGVSSVQSEIISAQNSSIFSASKAGSSAKASASDLDFSAAANVKTYISVAKDLASEAESEFQKGNYATARAKYQDARKKLTEATAEINKAKRDGEDLSQYSSEIDGLKQTYQDKSDECVKKSNGTNAGVYGVPTGSSNASLTNLYAQTLAQYNADTNQAWAERSTFMGGVSTGSVSTAQPGFWSNVWNGVVQQMPQTIGTAMGNAITGGGTQQAGGAGKTGSAGGTQSAGSAGKSGGSKSLDTTGVEDDADVKREESSFNSSVNKEKSLQSQIDKENANLKGIDAKLGDIDKKLAGAEKNLRETVQGYKKAKGEYEASQQAITKCETKFNEKESIRDGLKAQQSSLSSKYEGENKAATDAEEEAKTYTDTTVKAAENDVKTAESAVTAATTPAERETAEINLGRAKAKLAKAKAEELRLNNIATEKRKQANATKAELEKVNEDYCGNKSGSGEGGAIKEANDAKKELEDAKKAAEEKKKELDKQEGFMDDAGDAAEGYKKDIDELYEKQTEIKAKVSDLTSQKNIETMTQKHSQETVDKIKSRYKNGQRSNWNFVTKGAVGFYHWCQE